MDKATAQMMANLMMAANGGGLPGYEPGSFNPWDYSRMATLMPEQDSFFGPIGGMVAGMIPGMTVTGKDGNPTPVFKTNFRMQPSGLTGMQSLYAQQNAGVYGAAQRSHAASLRAGAAKFGEGLSNAASAAGAPAWMAQLGGMFGTDAGAGMAQSMVNNLLGYDRGVGVNVANARSPFMAASYMRNVGMQNAMEMTGNPEAMGHAVGERTNFIGGTENYMPFYNPFSDEFAGVRKASAGLAAGATDKLMWDGLNKRADVHGASEQYVAEIVSNALASGKVNVGDGEVDMTRLLEDQWTAQSRVDDINNRRSDKLDEMGVNQLREKIAEAKRNGHADEADTMQLQLDKVLEEELAPATAELEKVSEQAADGIRPLVEAVTGVTDSLRDFYGSEDEAKRALDELTGGQGSKDKAVADRMRDQITEVKALGAMAGLDPEMTGNIFKMSASIAGGIGGSRLGRNGGTGAAASVWSADLLKGIIGAGFDPQRANAQVQAHAAGQQAWNESRGKRALTMLEKARQDGLFEGEDDPEYQELLDLMTSGSRDDMDEAIKRFGKKYFGSEEAFNKFMANDQNVAEAYASLGQEGQTAVEEHGRTARGREMDRARNRAGYNTQQTQQHMALREAGISESEIDDTVARADFNSMKEFLSGNAVDGNGGHLAGNKAALDLFNREYEVALKEAGGDEAKAMRIAMSNFRAHGGNDILTADGSTEQLDQMQNLIDVNRTNAMMDMDMFNIGGKLKDMSVRKGGFFASVGAADKDNTGMTRSSMTEATKDMVEKLRKMGGVARTKGGEEISSDMLSDFEKRQQELMSSGKFQQARDEAEKFYASLDDTTRSVVEANGRKNTYRTTGNIRNQREAVKGANEIAMNEEQSKIMAGLNEDDRRELLQLYNKRNRYAENSDEEKKLTEDEVKRIRELEDKAKAEQQSDGEKIISAIQDGDLSKVFEVFKNGNATMEQFYDAIRRIIGLMDGTTATATEAARAGALGDSRRDFLEGETSTADRLAAAESHDAAQAFGDALGGGHVRGYKVEKWRKNMAKAAGGSKSAYQDALDQEKSFVEDSKAKLEKERKAYEKEAGGKSIEELEAAIGGETDDKKRARLQKQLSAAKMRDASTATISSLDSRLDSIAAAKKEIGGMSDTEFKEMMARSREESTLHASGQTTPGGAMKQGRDGEIGALVSKIGDLCNLLQQDMATRGSNSMG